MLNKDYDRKGSVTKEEEEEKPLVVILEGLGTKMNCSVITTSHKVTLTLTVALLVVVGDEKETQWLGV
jgi:hypothetical protein